MSSIDLDKRLFIVLTASIFLAWGNSLAADGNGGETGYLDGKVFLVERGEKGKRSDGKDTYIFRDGKFRSRYFDKKYGFETGTYTATESGDTITFVVETRSTSNGTIRWEGTVHGNEIDVRYTWDGRPTKWYQAKKHNPSEHWSRSVATWPTEDPGPPDGGSTSHLLDGKIFLVKSGQQGKEASHHDDYLIFRDGTFVSTDCGELLDFREATYSAVREGEVIRFRAQSTSPGHGTMIWDGTVNGDIMDATARWIDKRWYWTIDRMYWFRGKLFQ